MIPKKISIPLFSLVVTSAAHSAVISSADLGSLDLSVYGISIVHGTDLTAPAVQEAMRLETGIFFSTTQNRKLSAYDTEGIGGLDPDLERRSNNPAGLNEGEWAGGNLNPSLELGIIAVPQSPGLHALVQSTTIGSNPVFKNPNDDANGGVIIYNIDPQLQIGSFSVTAIDAEISDPTSRFRIIVNEAYEVDMVHFAQSEGLAPEFGNRTINDLGTVDLETLSGGAESVITRVEYIIENESGGSGGFRFMSNPAAPVPEPSSAIMILLAGTGLLVRKRS